jgi:hypothetical protein
MHGGNGRTRFAQSHALDQRHEVRRELAISHIGSFGSYQTHQPSGTVSGKPTLNGSERDTGITGSLRQKDTLVEVGSEHRKARHGLLALLLGACGQRQCHVLLLIQNALTPSPLCVRKRTAHGQVVAHVDQQTTPGRAISH